MFLLSSSLSESMTPIREPSPIKALLTAFFSSPTDSTYASTRRKSSVMSSPSPHTSLSEPRTAISSQLVTTARWVPDRLPPVTCHVCHVHSPGPDCRPPPGPPAPGHDPTAQGRPQPSSLRRPGSVQRRLQMSDSRRPGSAIRTYSHTSLQST